MRSWLLCQAPGFYLHVFRVCLVSAQSAGLLDIPIIAQEVALNFTLDMAQKAMYGLIEPYDIRAAVVLTLLGEMPAYYLYYSCMNVPNLLLSVFSLGAVFLAAQAASSHLFKTSQVPKASAASDESSGGSISKRKVE